MDWSIDFFKGIFNFFVLGLIFCVFIPCIAESNPAREQYHNAERFSRDLCEQIDQQKYRDKWLFCINEFNKVYKLNPMGPWAAAGLYRSGLLYLELYKRSLLSSDIAEVVDILERIIKRFPKSFYSGKARLLLKEILSSKTINSSAEKAKELLEDSKILERTKNNTDQLSDSSILVTELSSISGIRIWSNPTYTRVVIDLDKETSFTHKLVEQKFSDERFHRLYVDLSKSRLNRNIEKSVQVNDKLLKCANAIQCSCDVVKISVDIKSFSSYKIFSLKNPDRIVLDILGEDNSLLKDQDCMEDQIVEKKIPQGSIARQLSLGVSKIVIDPGHGGKDCGAIGAIKDVYEKNITLQIAKRLAKKVRMELGCMVVLTRETDRYLSLEERTAIANTENADLFISVHTNASENRNAYGIETFFLNLATDNEAILVAARENATSTKNISDLESILNDLVQNTKITESNLLASKIQSSLCSHMTDKYDDIADKGVKQAPFYVLLGAQMPAVLLETSFISNNRECNRLNSIEYQINICDGIVTGIKEYMKLR